MRKTVKRLTVKEYNQLKKSKEKEMPAFLNEAKTFANNFLMENFNMRLEIPIKMNGRLTRTMGRYLARNYFGSIFPTSIELSKTYLVAALIVGDLEEIYEVGFSTKGENRGLGLNNVKEIIDKYDEVILETDIETNYFIQVVRFKRKEKI